MVSEETSKTEKVETEDQPQDTANYVADYLRKNIKEDREDAIDTSIPSKHSQNVSNSTSNDQTPTAPKDIEKQRWDDPLTPLDQKFVTFKDMNDHYSKFLGRIQQQMSSMSGGGEVNLRNLDDVSRNTISDNRFLTYDQSSKKFIFSDLQDGYTTSVNDNVISVINLPTDTDIGPIESLIFDTNHDASTHNHEVGTICWDKNDDTLNIFHPNGVVQQIGQEQYAYVINNTGSTITNGTVVRFDGAAMPDGEARLEVAPLISDGSYPSLYVIGVSTHDIQNGENGKVAIFGKVRDIDTTGTPVGEVWEVGDILYASPSFSGNFTNVKPTAPDNVIPIGAVLRVDSINGELFIRPTIEQQRSYGRFARTDTQSVATINTPTEIIFNSTEISNGVSLGTPSSRIAVNQSGYYQFDLSIQGESSSNKGRLYLWLRKNGVDIPYTMRTTTVANGNVVIISVSMEISLERTDYVEVLWATTALDITLSSLEATSFGPDTASALLSVSQSQL